jgi:hypothetical protein
MAKSKIGALGGNEAGHLIGAFGTNNMTGTGVISRIIDIDEIDNISFDCAWTGTPTGTFTVEVSNSFLPNTTNMNGTPIRVGTWQSVTSAVDGTITNPAGSASNCLFGFNPTKLAMSCTYLRFRYTNTSGSGQLEVYVNGKAIGS